MRDPRFAELDRLIAMEPRRRGPKGPWGHPRDGQWKRARIEATAARMRAKYGRRKGQN